MSDARNPARERKERRSLVRRWGELGIALLEMTQTGLSVSHRWLLLGEAVKRAQSPD